MSSTDAFWSRYDSLLARLLSPLTPEDGIPEEGIAAAEKRLGFRLPRLLREFYLRAGQQAIRAGEQPQDSILSLDELSVEHGRLIYFASCQNVTFAAIPLTFIRRGFGSEDDPPSLQIENAAPPRIHEGPPLSEFLISLLLWQCVSGAMALTASEEVEIAEGWERSSASGGWERIDTIDSGWPFFVRSGQAVQVQLSTDLGSAIYAGARTWEDAEAIKAALGLALEFVESGAEERSELSDEEKARLEVEALERQRVKSQTPYGEAACVGCGRPLRVWADSVRNACGFCGSAL